LQPRSSSIATATSVDRVVVDDEISRIQLSGVTRLVGAGAAADAVTVPYARRSMSWRTGLHARVGLDRVSPAWSGSNARAVSSTCVDEVVSVLIAQDPAGSSGQAVIDQHEVERQPAARAAQALQHDSCPVDDRDIRRPLVHVSSSDNSTSCRRRAARADRWNVPLSVVRAGALLTSTGTANENVLPRPSRCAGRFRCRPSA
jgi:hypothetical protein